MNAVAARGCRPCINRRIFRSPSASSAPPFSSIHHVSSATVSHAVIGQRGLSSSLHPRQRHEGTQLQRQRGRKKAHNDPKFAGVSTAEEKATKNFTKKLKKMASSPDTIFEADKLLRQSLKAWTMADEDHNRLHDNKRPRPNKYSFATVLSGWSKSGIAGSAVRAEQLLNLMLDAYEVQERARAKDPKREIWLHLSPYQFSSAISAWARDFSILQDRQRMDPVERASDILNRMDHLRETYGRESVRPNTAVYNTVIRVCSSINNVKKAGRTLSLEKKIANAKLAEGIIRRMQAECKASNENARPDAWSYSGVLHAWAGASSLSTPIATERVEQILSHLERLSADSTKDSLRPNSFMYTTAMHAHSRSCKADAPEKCLALLDKMELLADSGKNPDARPTVHAYGAAINAFAKLYADYSTLRGIGVKADEILLRMKTRNIAVGTFVYNSVIIAWANSRHPHASARAEEIVEEMKNSRSSIAAPDISTYNSLIMAYAKSRNPSAPEKAEEVLNWLEKSFLNGSSNLKPQMLSYSAVLQAWAKSGRSDAAEGAQAVLDRMQKVKQGQNGRVLAVRPASMCYDALIDALSRSGSIDAAERIKQILRFMMDQSSGGATAMEPTTRTFQAAIFGLSQQADAARGASQAEELLREMIDVHSAGKRNVRVGAVSFSSVISAYAATCTEEGARRAYDLLREMFKMYQETGDRAIKPNTITWGAVIDAFAKCNSSGSAETAERLLRSMIDLSSTPEMNDLKPNAVIFNSVLNAIAKSDDLDPSLLAQKAEAMLEEMQRLSDTGYADVRPDVISFSSVIHAHSRAGNGSRAETLLRKMYEMYEDEGVVDVKPNVVAYTSTIQAYANSSHDPTAVSKADALFNEMSERAEAGEDDVRPNAGTCAIVLKIYIRHGDTALHTKAVDLLERMSVEYKSGNKLMKPGRSILSWMLSAMEKSEDEDLLERVKVVQNGTKY